MIKEKVQAGDVILFRHQGILIDGEVLMVSPNEDFYKVNIHQRAHWCKRGEVYSTDSAVLGKKKGKGKGA